MKNIFKNRFLTIIMVIILLLNISACSSKNKSGGEASKVLNIYIDIKDRYSLDIIKYLMDEYKKEKSDITLNVINPLDSDKLEEDIAKGGSGDLIFTSRNTMMRLNKKGLLNDLSNIYSKSKVSEKYYNILCTYGRIGDKYFGMGIIPFSLEVYYNSYNLQKMGFNIPLNINELVPIIKKMKEKNMNIPVAINEDLDIYDAFAALFFSNINSIQKLEDAYDNKSKYKELTDVQKVFNDIYYLVKQGVLTKEIFQVVNGDTAINRLIDGDTPLMIGTSYFTKKIQDSKINVVDRHNVSTNNENTPVIVNSIVCIPTTMKNEEGSGNFMEFILSDKTQKKLANEGFLTGDKSANGNFSGMNKIIEQHINLANSSSIVYLYNLPKPFQSQFEAKLSKVMGGNYDGNEWNEILDDIYKK
jgi:ABC-type sugar transport system, periplasmic component